MYMNKKPTYLITLETAIICNQLDCCHIINDIGNLYITEEHYFLLKAQNKKYNFHYSIDRNGKEDNKLPTYNYNQLEDIKSVMVHYNNVLDIVCNPEYKYCKQVWTALYECVKKYKTPLLPSCKADADISNNSLSLHNNDKRLCLNAKFNTINKEHIQDLIPNEYDKILTNKAYSELLNFVDDLNIIR